MKRFHYFLLIPILFSSCATWIAPTYTSVDKMLQVEKGMSSVKVDETLGIKPYNMLHRNDSTSIFEYHYRLKDRDVNNIIKYNDFIHQEQSQTGGENWFTKPSKFYVLYDNNKLSTLVTENGLENSDYLLLKNNNLILVSQSDLVNFKLFENASYLHKIDNTQKLKAAKSIKQSILFSGNFPYGLIGLKYAAGGLIGGYVSGALSIDYGEITYLTGGLLVRASSKINIYAGAGLGPYEEFRGLSSLVLEAGTLLYLNKFSIDAGAGFNLDLEELYVKIGFGFNF